MLCKIIVWFAFYIYIFLSRRMRKKIHSVKRYIIHVKNVLMLCNVNTFLVCVVFFFISEQILSVYCIQYVD